MTTSPLPSIHVVVGLSRHLDTLLLLLLLLVLRSLLLLFPLSHLSSWLTVFISGQEFDQDFKPKPKLKPKPKTKTKKHSQKPKPQIKIQSQKSKPKSKPKPTLKPHQTTKTKSCHKCRHGVDASCRGEYDTRSLAYRKRGGASAVI